MPTNSYLLPLVAIKLNGSDLPEATIDALIDIEVDSSLDVPSMVVMRFRDDEVVLMESAAFDVGKSIEIAFSDPTSRNAFVTVFKGEVTAMEPEFTVEGTVAITLRGYDKSHRLHRGTKARAFIQVKDSDIASKIIGEVGLTADVGATSVVHEHVYQDNVTDWEFLHFLAQRNGYELDYKNEKVALKQPASTGAAIALEWGESLLSFRAKMSIVGQVNEVNVRGWDIATKAQIVGTSSSSQANSHPAIGYGKTGGAAAQTALGSAQKFIAVRERVTDASDAQAIAKSILNDINAGFVEAEGVAFGNPNLISGVKVNVTGVGLRYGGTYRLTSARHFISADGYTTSFTVEGVNRQLTSNLLEHSAISMSSDTRWHGLVTAIVTNNKDPKSWGRVKVKFPWLDDSLESHWARVSSIGAGPQMGLYWLPEVNDEVLVAFENGDFTRPCVLGGVWNGKDAPPHTADETIKGGIVAVRTLKTKAGNIIRFTDENGKEKIEIIDAKQGTTITLDG
ncbi:MAG: VgrG-related protein, partial [Burkholderiales bacterium]|nr:VgrG-related protein [Anaerolineae bacterium]